MSVDARKGLRSLPNEHKRTKSTSIVLDSVLPPLTDFLRSVKNLPEAELSATPLFLSQHLDDLRVCQPIIAALEISLRQFSIFLSHGMTSCLVNWNLRGLGQGLFIDAPAVTEGACVSMVTSRVAAPLFTFPLASGPHLIECASRESYSMLYTSYTALQVSPLVSCVCGVFMCLSPACRSVLRKWVWL